MTVPIYQSHAGFGEMVELIKRRELEDLCVLGAKGRHRVHELLDQGKSRTIETIAPVDRTFQQRRLLEGGTTAHVGVLTKLIIESRSLLGEDSRRPSSKPDAGPVSFSTQVGPVDR